MLKQIVSYIGTISVIQNHRDLIPVTDPLEVEYIPNYHGYPASNNDDPLDFSGMFVSIRDGD